MGKRTNPMEKITQRSVGFHLRQILFFAEYPNFRPDEYCRKAVDNQIAEVNPTFLSKEDERYEETIN